MARKIDVKLILELRAAKMSRNMIAETRHISRHSVSDVFAIADRNGIEYKDVRNLDDNAVYQMFYPDKHVVESMFKEPDYEYIHDEREIRTVYLFVATLPYSQYSYVEPTLDMKMDGDSKTLGWSYILRPTHRAS